MNCRCSIPRLQGSLAGPVRRLRPSVALQVDSGPTRFRSQMILTPSHNREVRLDPDRLVRYEAPLDLSNTRRNE